MDLDSVIINSLTMSGAGKTYDITDFSASWAIDRVPQARCRVITGQGVLGSTKNVEWEDPDPGKLWTIKVKTSDGTETLFKGYILSVAESERLSPMGSKVSLLVTLGAEAVVLSSLQSASYSYWDLEALDTQESSTRQRPVINSRYRALAMSLASIMDEPETRKDVQALTGYGEVKSYDALNKYIISMAAYMHDWVTLGEGTYKISDFFKADRDIAFKPEDSGFSKTDNFNALITTSMGLAYQKMWQSGSVWSAVVGTARMFYLSVIPRKNNTVEIVPTFAWLKKPHITISNSLILGVQDTTNKSKLLYAPDQVRVVSHLPMNSNGAKASSAGMYVGLYPEEQGADKGKTVSMSIPDWLAEHVKSEFDDVPADKKTRVKSGEKPDEKRDELSTNQRNLESTADSLAKVFYAQRKSADRTVSLRIPWNRFSMINSLGYVAKIPNLSLYITSDKQTLYGMVQSVGLTISRSATGGTASMNINISHVRDEASNTKFGLDDNPLYSFDFASGASKIKSAVGLGGGSGVSLGDRLKPGGGDR